jgi:hypothetical protein
MQSRTHLSLAILLSVMLVAIRWMGCSTARGQSADVPTDKSPATQPDEELPVDSPIRKWFGNLADPDPRVRDQAREDLMGIGRDDLPKLRQLIIENQPLLPDQAAALKDIVIQAYLASQKYDVSDGREIKQTDPNGEQDPFFMGLLWPMEAGADSRLGVPVDERIPGFPSYRFLHPGDMILAIYMDPNATLRHFPNRPTQNVTDIKSAISSLPRTQNISLQVLRNGESLKIPIKMAPRPLDADTPDSLKQFISDRAVDADRYWNENFAPLVGRHPAEDDD